MKETGFINMKTETMPEVLAPAGNLTALYTAVDYGADAVYVGGQEFGMRAAPDNFTSLFDVKYIAQKRRGRSPA